MREAQDRQIDGWRYRVVPLGARIGQRILRRLLAGAGSLATASQETALARLVESISDDDLDYVTRELARSTQISQNGVDWGCLDDVYDLHFSGRYRALSTWVMFALQVNYPDFLAAPPPSERGAEDPATPSRSPFPTTSTGGSGAP